MSKPKIKRVEPKATPGAKRSKPVAFVEMPGGRHLPLSVVLTGKWGR